MPQILNAKYNSYLLLMREDQRAQFLHLPSDIARDQFLERQGLQQRKFLTENLFAGMSPNQVLQILDSPAIMEESKKIHELEERWTYKEFNGYHNINYLLVFKNRQLDSWQIWLN